MMSTDFKSLISPINTGAPRRLAKGGKAQEPPNVGALSHPQHTIIIMPIMPHPALGALAHAAVVHHLQMQHRLSHR